MARIVESGGRRFMVGRIYGLTNDSNKFVEVLECEQDDVCGLLRVQTVGVEDGDESVVLVPVKDIQKKPLGVNEAERVILRKILKNRAKKGIKASPYTLYRIPPFDPV